MTSRFLYSPVYPLSIFSLFLLFSYNNLAAQSRSGEVSGMVQNNNNEPLPGVSVVIKNARTNFSTGTSTDSLGRFTVRGLATGGTYSFVISTVGYENQNLAGYTIKEGSPVNLMMKMVQTSASLDQVVVVGYGTQKRKDLTGSVASISTKDIKDLAITRVEQALSGRVAGVQVKLADGQPGSSPQIRIRGIGSISAGVDPLYVVDGFPTDNIQTLNPNDIETLDILKDASATAIYGSRGSNGVVIINTTGKQRQGEDQLRQLFRHAESNADAGFFQRTGAGQLLL